MKKIIISRTDSIGDVILTLPMAGVLKKHFPDCTVYFLGRKYTRAVIEACEHVDEFIDAEEITGSRQLAVGSRQLAVGSRQSAVGSWQSAVGSRQSVTGIRLLKDIGADIIIHAFPVKEICRAAKKAGIPLRIGSSHRWFTWLYCNKLLHFSRKNSGLHEAQLNLKMLGPLGIQSEFSLKEIPEYYGLTAPPCTPLPQWGGVGGGAFRLILHPKSKGSAREWGLDNFSRLIDLLPEDNFRIYITGTKEESLLMKDFLQKHEKRVTDLTGKLNLAELLGFISSCDGLVAASTGPLHIAAAFGKVAIGLFAPMKPIYPKRWAPLGIKADFLVLDKKCSDCRHSADCECIRSIKPCEVAQKILSPLQRASS